jgi:type I restriction enzyme M protein
LGQYFTMRQIARFTVAMLEIDPEDYCLDPTAGSGGFLLEVLLQVWHGIDRDFAGSRQQERIKNDFALDKVFGIEIHDVLARICKINLLLHHDGHTNIEGDRSCLDAVFSKPRLNPPRGKFTRIVGNPPFGDEVKEGDEDHLGANHLHSFSVANSRESVASEHVILERCVELLEPNGRLGLVLPDGVFNNQGELSNCPRVRRLLVKQGVVEAIISLPDHAFRRSGAQNKTSILFLRKFTAQEKVRFDQAFSSELDESENEDRAIVAGLAAIPYQVFLAEANRVGYTTTGSLTSLNDLYRGATGGHLDLDQSNTILGEYRKFSKDPTAYSGNISPDCMAIDAATLWQAHPSHRLDPKYFLFKREERMVTPSGWIRQPIGSVMRKRENLAHAEASPETYVKVMTISQTGEIRPREAGKGKNPPEWLGMYFEDSSSTWYSARAGDVVFSSIDLWKGCISVVPEDFDGALVTKEFPIYEVIDDRLDPGFLWCLLRSRYYQRAFRAITTGHSNRRRTQVADFENLEIVFPADRKVQQKLIESIFKARVGQRTAATTLRDAMMNFSDTIDGRIGEELIELADDGDGELEQ